jgi:outer membrane protein TolC
MRTVVMRGSAARGSVVVAGILFSVAWAAIAQAAPADSTARPAGAAPVTQPGVPAAPGGQPTTGAPATDGQPPAPATVPPPPDTTVTPPPRELLEVHAGGLTAEHVSERAAATSYNAKANEQALRGATARVDEAWAAFLPRLSGIGKYTRLSPLTPPSFGTLVTAENPNAFINPMTGQPRATTAADPAGALGLLAIPLTIPVVLDNWLFQATLTVPISDYLARTNQNYTAATHSQEAARWDVLSARASSGSNGKIAYFNWLGARAGVVVAVLTLDDQKTHYRDAQNQFAVGNASKADVLRAETNVASAELALDRAKNLSELTEEQLRVAIHAPEGEPLVPGEDLEGTLAPVQGNVKDWTREALTNRAEIRSANANAESARELVWYAKGGNYPALSAFADGIVANPNSRIFPPSNRWFPSWDVGAQVTWSPNDALVTGGAVTDAESKVASIEANRQVVRDNIDVEVVQSWQAVQEADFSLQTSARELASAQEAYRVARELFTNGRGTSTTLTDAERDLTNARFDLLNAKVAARIGRVKLEHALGRDTNAR